MENWSEIIFSEDISFEEKTRKVFEYQYENCSVYRRYCKALDDDIQERVQEDIKEIPFLPVRAFKDATLTTQPEQEPVLIFKSSGTTGMERSVHRVMDASLYEQSIVEGFNRFYDLDNAVVWGYTPGYSENPNSSLVYMIQKLIRECEGHLSRFLPLDEPLNKESVDQVERSGKQLIIFGAAFGLLDLLERKEVTLPANSIVIETGGMKTHQREISRDELHKRLARGFGIDISRVHSEYGMAELLSQAYATGGNWFRTVPWMQVTIRSPQNPAEELPPYSDGLIGIIDLANVHSCSFLLTGDRGMLDNKGRFKVMGRWNPKDLRGCNFLIEED